MQIKSIQLSKLSSHRPMMNMILIFFYLDSLKPSQVVEIMIKISKRSHDHQDQKKSTLKLVKNPRPHHRHRHQQQRPCHRHLFQNLSQLVNQVNRRLHQHQHHNNLHRHHRNHLSHLHFKNSPNPVNDMLHRPTFSKRPAHPLQRRPHYHQHHHHDCLNNHSDNKLLLYPARHHRDGKFIHRLQIN